MMASFIPLLLLLLSSTSTHAELGSDMTIRVYFDDRSVWSKELDLDQAPQCNQIIFPARKRYAGRAPRIAAIVADNNLSPSTEPNTFDFTLYLEDSSLLCDPDMEGESYDLKLPYYAPGWNENSVRAIRGTSGYGGGGQYPSSDSDSDDEGDNNNDYGLAPYRGMMNRADSDYDIDGEERKWPDIEDLGRPPILQRFRDYTEDFGRPLYRGLGGRRNAVFGQYDDQESLLNNRNRRVTWNDEVVEFSAQDVEDQAQIEASLAPGLAGNRQDNVEIVDETSLNKRSLSKRAIQDDLMTPPPNQGTRVSWADLDNAARPLLQDDSDSGPEGPMMFFSGPAGFTLYPKTGFGLQPDTSVEIPVQTDDSLMEYLDVAMENLLSELYGRESQV
ncbi:hypothetical protein Dda_7300 [Drechslerella dactyloides]|uniref:Uncharacterized protein n=1 Tax=Drechslerella dactyloides TaxID=74499 RepID=A0AAD6NGK6_DREDA|nr:hypothetical protein Dda_7300 [Drechslerella dactyloides]